jgi:L-threonylcarbamoyladenylate synthase
LSAAGRWSWGDPVDRLREAVAEGRIVAIPTESAYGLGVDPCSVAGVEAIYRVKRREAGKPLPVVAASRRQAEELGASFEDPRLMRLSQRWPGPLSLLVPVSRVPAASAGTGSLALRVPGHERLVDLLGQLGRCLTATSANRSGEPALTDPAEVADLLDEMPGAIVIDDGVLPGGQPSTLVGVGELGVEILRPGRIGSEELKDLLGANPTGSFSAASVEILADGSR